MRRGMGSAARCAAWLMLAALLALAGCESGATARQTSTATTAPSPTAIPTRPPGPRPSPVVGELDPAPADCAAVPPPQTYHQDGFGGGFSPDFSGNGAPPVWELGLGDGGPLHMSDYGSQPYPSIKVMWVVGPDYLKPVTLEGRDIRTGFPLWFQVFPSNSVPTSDPDADSVYTTQALLDPAAPNRGDTFNSTGHWNIWGIGIIMLRAGCYQLDVSWAEGHWSTTFAAGR